MTALELERIARGASASMPTKATGFRLVTDVEPCSRLANGSPSGIVTNPDGSSRAPRVRFGVAWFVDERLTGSVIAWFERQGDAHKLLAVLRGERPASRSGPDLAPASTGGAVEQGQGRIEAPGTTTGASLPGPAATSASVPPASSGIRCAHCGGPIDQPLTGRPRITCSDACRQAHRRAVAVTKLADDTEPTDGLAAAGRPALPPAPADSDSAPTDTTSAIPARSRDEGAEVQLVLPAPAP